MSKIILFGLDNMSVGEITAVCNRGYMVYGSASTAGGGSTTITVTQSMLASGMLQPGRMVLVLDEKLPPWAGMIDTPIELKAPASITIYNLPYMLTMRSTYGGSKISGTPAGLVGIFVDRANGAEDMYFRLGRAGGSAVSQEINIDGRPFWDQINSVIVKNAAELTFRPKREPTDGNRLYTYVDVDGRAGYDTDFLLHEGRGGNTRISKITLDRQVYNRIIGINNTNAFAERLTTAAKIDQPSISAFRLRSKSYLVNTKTQSVLEVVAQNHLNDISKPIIKFDVLIQDVRDTFAFLAPGNGVILHSPNTILPDGRRGWRGTTRIMAMAYNEKDRTIGATLEARYELQ